MSHHSNDQNDQSILDAMAREFMEPRGKTGKFPDGKIAPSDEGEVRLGVAHKDGVILVDFGTPIAWIGFRPNEVDAFCELLQKHKREVLAEQ